MNTPCKFDLNGLTFVGSPVEQARCLLRFVKRGGDVDDVPPTLPSALEDLLTKPDDLGIKVGTLRNYLKLHDIKESSVGGAVDKPVSRADSNDPAATLARYFVIHDTSSKLAPGQTFDPNFINTAKWSGNALADLERGKTHIYTTRLGETLTDADYQTAWRATQFELRDTVYRGLFLHHELVQPRMGQGKSDIDAPKPGFTQQQYERLALQYIIASVRRGSWMIPAFHCVLDLKIGDHDDPQQFDLAMWGMALEAMVAAVRQAESTDAAAKDVNATSPAAFMHLDTSFVAEFTAQTDKEFSTPVGKSSTKDGSGRAATTGLTGTITTTSTGETIIDAAETIIAERSGKSLGSPRRIRQTRTIRSTSTVVSQASYCWQARSLPDAVLFDQHPGFGSDPAVISGLATFFGKNDNTDEGTGSPAFCTVQTCSSVFGISLKEALLVELGLITKIAGEWAPTDKGLNAVVEVFFPDSKRMARLPLVDIGPGNPKAIADLTVAASSYLQAITEDQFKQLDNIKIQARVIA